MPELSQPTFTFEDFEGVVLRGDPDPVLLHEALNRFREAHRTHPETATDILEFPFLKRGTPSQIPRNIHIRYHADRNEFEIKIHSPGPYNTRKLTGHFLLKKPRTVRTYEMTVH